MDNVPPTNSGSGNFFARYVAQRPDQQAQARQLCADFRDFCESVGHHAHRLNGVYNELPNAIGLRAALSPTDMIVRIIAQNSQAGIPVAEQFMSDLDTSDPGVSGKADAILQANLRSIAHYIKGMRVVEKMLQSTLDIARQRADNGPESEKTACAQWLTNIAPLAETLRFENDAMQAALDMVKPGRAMGD